MFNIHMPWTYVYVHALKYKYTYSETYFNMDTWKLQLHCTAIKIILWSFTMLLFNSIIDQPSVGTKG